MCGITGFWSARGSAAEEAQRILRTMNGALRHRGPDDAGEWYDASAGVALGHRRLSIVDLSAEGHQPMASQSGRFLIVFNGEVYNFIQLRAELERLSSEPLRLRGHSDTEIMLAAIEHWGLSAAVQRFIGMFAFALWDRQERRLHLVRDRLGIKPLFYTASAGTVIFGSELQSVAEHPAFSKEIDPAALRDYFGLGYVPAPSTIYRTARKLAPGTIATFHAADAVPELEHYWTAHSVAERGVQTRFRGDLEAATDALEEVLTDAVRLRMVADVPLGAFLSGGIDSSLVVALMQRSAGGRVRTFSIGNDSPSYDESAAAEAVAKWLGTEHTTFRVTARQALDVAPTLGAMFDEPFADSSQIPTFLVSQLARSQVTVSLSGDGGDELFGGYNRHIWAPRVMRVIEHVPRKGRHAVATVLRNIPAATWDNVYATAKPILPKLRLPGDKVHKLASVLDVTSARQMYQHLCAQWQSPNELMRSSLPPSPEIATPSGLSFAEQMMFLDLVTYLPDDILTKVDRASMAVGLEARVPLLDHRVVELAWSLPESFKIDRSVGKRVLRHLLARFLPPQQLSAAKMGFGVPVGSWLRGSLKEWAATLLSPASIMRSGLLEPEPITRAWHEHSSGRADRTKELWTALMFVSWFEAKHPRQG